MKVTMVSNYINHHQIPFCSAMYGALGADYAFIQTEPMEQERVSMGWKEEKALPYVYCGYEQPEVCRKLIETSDVVIWGGVEDETWLKPRLEAGRPVLRYCERMYKTGLWKAVSPKGLWKKYHDHTRHNNKPVYLLCAGAYVPLDFRVIRAYTGKRLRWGYFPETRHYDVDNLLAEKAPEILWAARWIDWKHPELMVELARKLREKGLPFHITMVGDGEVRPQVEQMIWESDLAEYITLTGVMGPDGVRGKMEQASIFVMTSDREEGWGAVVNEAMNSGCAVVAGHMAGCVRYLIEDGRNGFIYRDGDAGELAEKVSRLLTEEGLCERMGRSAYDTIVTLWNAETAAARLLKLCEQITKGEEITFCEEGPLSQAPVLKERINRSNGK